MKLNFKIRPLTQPLKTGDILLFDEHPTLCCMNFLDSCIKLLGFYNFRQLFIFKDIK